MGRRTNPKLADAASPYLQEAADQPVDWLPWGKQALEKATAEGKPVLVDSGAVWCHWCHVMDHESYEDPATAQLINERFVAVKLDRDERPDVDRRLQRAVQALVGRGGWPLTAFLTPDGEVFYGGTYFPREATGGMPAFKDVLGQVADLFDQEPERAREQAERIQQALDRHTEHAPGGVELGLVEQAIDQALSAYDPQHGGFGSQPKFPHPASLDLLLAWSRRGESESEQAWSAAAHTLEAMAEGGVYDQLAGGFHRYSVDAAWRVPHFEKMLYDNGPLLGTYSRAAGAARERGDQRRAASFEAVARGIAGFMLDVLGQPEGGFGGSQDADRRPEHVDGPLDRDEMEDGEYFTWTLAEVRELLEPQELKIARLHFGIEEQGEMHHDASQNVLRIDAHPSDIAEGLAETLEDVETTIAHVRSKLQAARQARPAPFVDPTVYTDWNGLAITGLLTLDQRLGAPGPREAALGALDRLLDQAWDPGHGFAHALSPEGPRVHGLLDDQAQMLPALIEAFHTTQQARYLEHASLLAELVLDRFVGPHGALTVTAESDEPASPSDQPTPSPIGQLTTHLPRLSALTGEPRWAKAAGDLLAASSGRAGSLGGVHGGQLHLAILGHLAPDPHIVVVGEPEQADAFRREALGHAPGLATVLQVLDPEAPGVPPEAREAATSFQHGPAAIVCQDRSCQLAEDPASLQRLLASHV